MDSNALKKKKKKFKEKNNKHSIYTIQCVKCQRAIQPPDPVSSQNPTGLHDSSSSLLGQDGYPKPRLAGQSALATPHFYYNFPCKAIYVVWQHNSYKQNEYIDS